MAFKLAMEISTVKMVVRNIFYRIFHATQNDHGNFHRQNGRKEYFLPHFSRNAKWPWKFPTSFVKMEKTMEMSNVVVGKSSYFWLSEDSFLLSSRAKSSFLKTTYF